ncbi:MAG TPA: class I SAM-dependent methyltransferase [Acidobacteriaceae bacterium]|nr:class I SAM-dependent methyltransferase [Acidobacteriaceae bacterium]
MCGASDHTLYLDGEENALRLESVGSSRTVLSHGRILRCLNCGLAYRSYRPTIEQLGQFYRAADDEKYEAEMPNRVRTANWHRRIAEKHVPIKGCLLDIGCASGAFMGIMREAGWRVVGIEPSDSQYRRAMKLLGSDTVIHQSMLENLQLDEEFDLITLWDVLEHVSDPPQFLRLAASHLKQGGCLIVNVPRIDSLQARVLGPRWPLLLAEHLAYFTIPSLVACGNAAGLKLVHTQQRPSAFSVDYVLFRIGQHGIPGTLTVRKLLQPLRLETRCIPVWMGEVCAVFRKEAVIP